MADQPPPDPVPLPPVSAVAGVTGELLQQQFLSAPSRPGHLASLGSYDIVGELGRGGMGVVLQGLDSRDGTRVAIKILKPELAGHPQLVQRFLKEARHMQGLKHPNILPVLEVAQNASTAYFVMPLMEGGSLDRQLCEDQPMAEDDAVAVGRQIASALSHAHTKGLIHRDLKPGNVLLDKDGKAYLGDFGLARTLVNPTIHNPERGDTGEGTAPYMSPQLARGEVEDTRCDIYAFGALLYEMLAGKAPYEGKVASQVLEQIKRSAPEPISKVRPKLSPNLVRIVEGAMARELRDRYASMADVLADLERIEAAQTPVGPHTTFSWSRFAGGRTRMVLGVTCGAVLAGGMLGIDWSGKGNSLERQWAREDPAVFTWTRATLGDWDGDGVDEILTASGNELHVLGSVGQPYKPLLLEKPNGQSFELELMADVNGDGMEEAFVSWSQGADAHITVFNQKVWPIREFLFKGTLNVHPEFGTNFTTIHPLQLADLAGDGRKKLLASVTSSWSLKPRGVCSFDLATGQLEWFFETANFVLGVELVDLDGDGQQEIVVGGNAPGNGTQLPDGTDDLHAYVYVISSDGQLRWRRELGGLFGCVRPIHRSGTNSTALVWINIMHAYTIRRGEPDMGQVLEFDAQGGVVRSHDFKIQLTSALAADLNSDGIDEILAGDRLGNLHVLDKDFKTLQSLTVAKPQFGEVDMLLFDFGPLGPSRTPHLVLATSQVERPTEPAPGNSRQVFETILYHDNRVRVFDAALNPVATHLAGEKWTDANHFGPRAQLTKGGPDSPPELLVLTHSVEQFALTKDRPAWFARARP